jgi:hypothetical protein
MVRLTLNVDDEVFEGSGFELVPTGRKRVVIFDINEREVKTGVNAGKPRLNFQFKIVEGEPNAGRYLFTDVNAFETPSKKDPSKMNPMYDLIAIGSAIGLSAEQIRNFDSDEWLGEELFLTVVHEEKKTKESNYTESFDPPEYREAVKGFRSTKSVTTSVGAAEAVASGTKAATGARATAKAGAKPKFTL